VSVIARRAGRESAESGSPAVTLKLACLFVLLASGLVSGAVAQGGAVAQVDVVLDGETYNVRASAQLAADRRVVWDTLTDYERLPDFVPGVTSARVVAHDSDQLTIEQIGVFPVFLFDLPVRVRLAVQHTPYTTVIARLVPNLPGTSESTLRSFSGRYTLSAVRPLQGAGVRLDYDAQFQLARPLPVLVGPLFGVSAVRRTMREQFEAMLREIQRRQAALAAGGHVE
jgi:hypothetical protein